MFSSQAMLKKTFLYTYKSFEKGDLIVVTEKKNFIMKYTLLALVLGFFLLHMTPVLSLRTHLFFRGHFREACVTNFTKIEKKEEDNNQFTSFYTADPPLYEKHTNSELVTYKVEGAIIYFASYYGEV